MTLDQPLILHDYIYGASLPKIDRTCVCENNDNLEVQPSTQQNRVWQTHVKIEYSYGYMCLEHSQVSAESYFWECVMSFFVHKCLKTSHFFFV